MSSKQPQQQPIAFFGATGGCASTALALALKAGYHATALARTPEKLHDLLVSLEVPESVISSSLTIVKGAAQDYEAVKATIAPGNVPVAHIISGIGGAPKMSANPLRLITFPHPHVCEEAFTTIFGVLRDLISQGVITSANRPSVTAISTTGISKTKDVPCAMIPFYQHALNVPHQDKAVMETLIEDAASEGIIESFVFVRPAYLLDGPFKGISQIRTGWESPAKKEHNEKQKSASKKQKELNPEEPGPAVGYGISRTDVGNWIYEKLIKEKTTEFNGKAVSLTY